MLLRRITEHVRAQNWFAVGIDFAIVVIGVYIGIQVSNWNDEVRVRSLEASYLSRVGDELMSNIEMFEAEVAAARESRAVLSNFIAVMESQPSADEKLVNHAREYLSAGVFFAKFRPSQATFDELKSTGNLDIIQDSGIREALIELHTFYQDGRDVVATNSNWATQMEGAVYLGFDAFRFDSRTAALFSEQPAAVAARQIRDNRDLLIRHAALSYWVKDRSIEILDGATDRSMSVLQKIQSAL